MCKSPGWRALSLCCAEQLAEMPGSTSHCCSPTKEQDITRSSVHLCQVSDAQCCAVVQPAMSLWFLFFFSLGMGLNISGKQSPWLAPLWADLAEAMHHPPAGLWEEGQGCLHAITWILVMWLTLGTNEVPLGWFQSNCTVSPWQEIQGKRTTGGYAGLLMLLFSAISTELPPQPSSTPGRSAAPYTQAGGTCTVRSFFIIPPCQSGTFQGHYFLFPLKENTMTILQMGWLF